MDASFWLRKQQDVRRIEGKLNQRPGEGITPIGVMILESTTSELRLMTLDPDILRRIAIAANNAADQLDAAVALEKEAERAVA
jgi:hypothetical protein